MRDIIDNNSITHIMEETHMTDVAIFLADGCEEIEALTVVDIVRRAGLVIDTVSVTGEKKIISAHKITIMADKLFDEVDFSKVEMIVLPGGMPGTDNLEAFEPLMGQVDAFDRAGKYVSAICAAPRILGHRGILKGRTACCYPGNESQLTDAKVTYNRVEVSENIITSRGMGCAISFALAIVECFLGREKSNQIRNAIVYEV